MINKVIFGATTAFLIFERVSGNTSLAYQGFVHVFTGFLLGVWLLRHKLVLEFEEFSRVIAQPCQWYVDACVVTVKQYGNYCGWLFIILFLTELYFGVICKII